ncbi:MAG: hypothetical protein IKP38_00150 [Clostridia bacterium]|nr:hypothetical protein [Clostridia bacterium]
MKKNYALKFITVAMIIAAMVRMIFGFMMINFISNSTIYEVVSPEILRISIFALAFVVLNVVAELIAGFVGAVNWEEAERAPACFIWGLISLVTGVVANILQIRCGYGASVYAWILGVGVPALYTLAALVFLIFRVKPKKNAAN